MVALWWTAQFSNSALAALGRRDLYLVQKRARARAQGDRPKRPAARCLLSNQTAPRRRPLARYAWRNLLWEAARIGVPITLSPEDARNIAALLKGDRLGYSRKEALEIANVAQKAHFRAIRVERQAFLRRLLPATGREIGDARPDWWGALENRLGRAAAYRRRRIDLAELGAQRGPGGVWFIPSETARAELEPPAPRR